MTRARVAERPRPKLPPGWGSSFATPLHWPGRSAPPRNGAADVRTQAAATEDTSRYSRWTLERKALVCREYPRGTNARRIVAACNALPGRMVTLPLLYGIVAGWQLRRPDSHRRPEAHPRWTPERRRLLRAQFVTKAQIGAIVAALNALPGERISATQLGSMARRLGLRRPLPAHHGRWSQARVALARRDYVAGVPTRAIVAAVNALPGPAITLAVLYATARDWGLRRPPQDRHRGAMPRTPAAGMVPAGMDWRFLPELAPRGEDAARGLLAAG